MYIVNRPHRAFTLVEMMLAISVSGMVILAVVSMLSAVSYGTSSRLDARGLLVRCKTLDARIGSAIRSSKEVKSDEMSAGSSFLILWTADANSDDVKDNAEMRLIDFDSGDKQINNHYNPAAAGVYANVAAFRSAVSPEAWATGVSACTFDAETSGSTTLVTRRTTLNDGDVSMTSVGAAAGRN